MDVTLGDVVSGDHSGDAGLMVGLADLKDLFQLIPSFCDFHPFCWERQSFLQFSSTEECGVCREGPGQVILGQAQLFFLWGCSLRRRSRIHPHPSGTGFSRCLAVPRDQQVFPCQGNCSHPWVEHRHLKEKILEA